MFCFDLSVTLGVAVTIVVGEQTDVALRMYVTYDQLTTSSTWMLDPKEVLSRKH